MPLKFVMTIVSAACSLLRGWERGLWDQANKEAYILPFAPLADLNLVDWSSGNVLAVALDNCVYLWSASSGDILQLLQMEQPGDYVSSVSWIKEGNYLAVGTSSAEVQVRLVPVLQLYCSPDPGSLPGRRMLCQGPISDCSGSLSSYGMCNSRSGFGI